MIINRQFLLACILVFSSIAAFAQTPKQELNDQFWEAVRKGDLALVTSLLDKGADVNAKFRYGTTALFKAAERGYLEIVKLLLARGADASVKDTFYGATAMTWALENGHADVVSALLEKDPGSVNDVLMTGVRGGKTALVKVALARGDVKPETLTAALVLANDDKDHAEIADMLKKAGAVAPPELDAALLQSYVGKYKDEAGTEIAITLTNGRLFAVPTGQRPFALMAVNNTTFRPVAFDGIVVSFKLEAGNITSLELKRGQVTTQMKRVTEAKQP
jgi:ankyrin repeat protein